MLEKIDGMVMKTSDYSETHKIVTIFSKKLGKFNAIARGAKKPKSRMAAVTQPFIYAQFFVYVNKGLSTIQQGEIINSNRLIREDIIKTAYAAYVAELTDKIMEEKEPDLYIFNQFQYTMNYIAENEEAEIPVMMYEMKLYKKGGFAPTINRCVNCGGNEIPMSFSLNEGGLLCSRCRHVDPESLLLPKAIIKLLYVLSEVGLERVNNISVKEENKQLLRKLLNQYFDRYGGYFIKSRKFLDQLDMLK